MKAQRKARFTSLSFELTVALAGTVNVGKTPDPLSLATPCPALLEYLFFFIVVCLRLFPAREGMFDMLLFANRNFKEVFIILYGASVQGKMI